MLTSFTAEMRQFNSENVKNVDDFNKVSYVDCMGESSSFLIPKTATLLLLNIRLF